MNDVDSAKAYEKFYESVEWIEDWERDEFYKKLMKHFEYYELSGTGMVYTHHFKFLFNILQEVSEQVLEAVQKQNETNKGKLQTLEPLS